MRGIAIGAHWSWVFVFALLAWSLSVSFFPPEYPQLDGITYLLMGLSAAILFFLSIVLHELGHATRALREGMKIKEITLWLFGGVAKFEGMFPTAGAEFRIAIAGPVVSIALALLFVFAGRAADALALPEPIVGVLSYLGRINALVVAFNLVPALPLDGGRVLRSWLWQRQRSYGAATVSAARAGKAFAYMLISIGILSFFTQAVTGGIWFVFLGWFLLQAAQAEVTFVYVRQAFRGVRVGDLMTRDPVTVSPVTTISQFIDETVRTNGHSTYPVTESGSYLGLISLRIAGEVDPSERSSVTVGEVMLPAEQTSVLSDDDTVIDNLDALRSGGGRAIVLDNNRLVGMLSMSDIAKSLELEQVRGIEQETPVRRAGTVVWVVVTLILVLAGSAFYRPPLALISPGTAVDVARDITISGTPTTNVNGKYLLVAVSLSRPTGLEALAALFRPDQDLLLLSSVMPSGSTDQQFIRQQKQVFSESQRLAAAAAAQAAGLNVELVGNGALVQGTIPGSPADNKLRAGDVITKIDEANVALATDLRRVTTQQPSGTSFSLQVERAGKMLQVRLTSSQFETPEGPTTGLGIYVSTKDFNVDLPFEISFKSRNIGGPSAGLAYALAITDILEARDLAKGKTIAASGTIDAEGSVGPVGGLHQKLRAARTAGASLLIVPKDELSQVQSSRLRVNGVDRLIDAVEILSAA